MSDQAKQPTQVRCFVVGPIGAEGTPEHDRADWLLEYIIKEALACEPFNFKVERADEFTEPGLITDQVVNAVLTADFVVADLTGLNANAFYELGVRHMTGKPTIHMAAIGQALPFDVKDYRTIFYDLTSPHRAKEATKHLRDQCASIMHAVAKSEFHAQNPVTKAQLHQKLATSADKKDQEISVLLSENEHLKVELKRAEDERNRAKAEISASRASRTIDNILKFNNVGIDSAAIIGKNVGVDQHFIDRILRNAVMNAAQPEALASTQVIQKSTLSDLVAKNNVTESTQPAHEPENRKPSKGAQKSE